MLGWVDFDEEIDSLIAKGWPVGAFRHLAARVAEVNDWRYGQACFNLLYWCDPEIAEMIRGTLADPFYAESQEDPRVVRFYKEVFGG